MFIIIKGNRINFDHVTNYAVEDTNLIINADSYHNGIQRRWTYRYSSSKEAEEIMLTIDNYLGVKREQKSIELKDKN